MDHGREALIGFVGAHGDAVELLELAEEVLDQMAPLVHLGVDRQRCGAPGCCEMTILAPRSSRSAMMALLSKALSAMKPPKSRPSIAARPRRCRSAGPAAARTGRDCRAHRSAPGSWSSCRPWNGRWPGSESPFCALSVAVDPDDGGIDHGVLHVRLLRAGLEKPDRKRRL